MCQEDICLCLETILVIPVLGEGFLLASDESRPGMLLNILYCPMGRDGPGPAQNVSSARAQGPHLSEAMGRTGLECPGKTPREGTVLPCASPHFTDEKGSDPGGMSDLSRDPQLPSGRAGI